MCGIVGLISNSESTPDLINDLVRMSGRLSHRGPDSHGVWTHERLNLGFAHRRLAIVDTTDNGSQPMLSPSRRYTVAFNGEIYNHRELRDSLRNSFGIHEWVGNSDTETITVLLDYYGVVDTVPLLKGMFAIAIWDNTVSSLSLVRDRFGEKPLYYGQRQGQFMFASEIQAIEAAPKFEPLLSREALKAYFKFNYIPTPMSIYQGVFKLEPASILSYDLKKGTYNHFKYWKLDSSAPKLDISLEEAEKKVGRLLENAVKSQLMSDVPLGAFLSGGVDSSLIVSLMSRLSDKPVKTFSIGFEDPDFNEAQHAKRVADHLGTNHYESYATIADVQDVIKGLSYVYSEPFADSSQIPTVLVSRLAKNHVTVALSGDAGDEIFGGYNRYIIANTYWSKISRIPYVIRQLIANIILSISPYHWDKMNFFLSHLMMRKKVKNVQFGRKISKFARILTAKDLTAFYDILVSNSGENYLIDNSDVCSCIYPHIPDVNAMMENDIKTYMMDDILVKVDRAAMSTSLETRIPFLDVDLVEEVFGLNLDLKIFKKTSKILLRELLYKTVPKELIERPKQGFAIPLDEILRGPLKEWVEDLIDKEKMERDNLINADLVHEKWQQHLSGKYDHQQELWTVLMFQLWRKDRPFILLKP